VIGSSLTFPLVSRRRLIGLQFGSMHGARRGSGSDIAGSRAYIPGDDPHRIDWGASGRLSAARGTDEFVVREYFADEAPRVVVCLDRRAGMTLCPPGLPFLHKDEAASVALGMIEASVAESRGLIGLLEVDGREGVVGWCPPASGRRTLATIDHELPGRGAASADAVTTMFEFLTLHRRAVPSASFVFVVSDFIEPTPLDTWEWALDRGWDIVPVVVQDPVWEQGFPDVDRLLLPLSGVDGKTRAVRLEKGESRRWRERHEARLSAFVDGLRSLGIEPVMVSRDAHEHVFDAFLRWSMERQAAWGHAA
jgi:uncharacterized protein (DUF58 family)